MIRGSGSVGNGEGWEISSALDEGPEIFKYLRLVLGVLKDEREMSGREGNDFRKCKRWGDRGKREGGGRGV